MKSMVFNEKKRKEEKSFEGGKERGIQKKRTALFDGKGEEGEYLSEGKRKNKQSKREAPAMMKKEGENPDRENGGKKRGNFSTSG